MRWRWRWRGSRHEHDHLPVGTSNSPVLCRGWPLVIRALNGYLTRRAAGLARLRPMGEAAVDVCSDAYWRMLARMCTAGEAQQAWRPAGAGAHLRSSHFTPPACSPTGQASSQAACGQEHRTWKVLLPPLPPQPPSRSAPMPIERNMLSMWANGSPPQKPSMKEVPRPPPYPGGGRWLRSPLIVPAREGGAA